MGGAALLGAGLLFFLRRRRAGARARAGPRPTIDWEDGDKHREESVPQEVSPFVSVLTSCPPVCRLCLVVEFAHLVTRKQLPRPAPGSAVGSPTHANGFAPRVTNPDPLVEPDSHFDAEFAGPEVGPSNGGPSLYLANNINTTQGGARRNGKAVYAYEPQAPPAYSEDGGQ